MFCFLEKTSKEVELGFKHFGGQFRLKKVICIFFLFWHHQPGLEDISPNEEVTDTEDNEEEDLGVLDDQRSVILHLLSQLKLGMDLTRVRH